MDDWHASLLSSLGAGVLGFGLGALFSGYVRGAASAIILLGLIMHGVGMYLSRRTERPGWTNVLTWLCWVLLAVILAWLIIKNL